MLQMKRTTKPAISRASPAPGGAQKADAANQTKPQAISPATQTPTKYESFIIGVIIFT